MSLLIDGEQSRQTKITRRRLILNTAAKASRLLVLAALTGCARENPMPVSPTPTWANAEIKPNLDHGSGICEVSIVPQALVDAPNGFSVVADDVANSLRFSLYVSPTSEHLILIDGHLRSVTNHKISSDFGVVVPLVSIKDYQGNKYLSYFQMVGHTLDVSWNGQGILTDYTLDDQVFVITDAVRAIGIEAQARRSGFNPLAFLQQKP